MVYWCTLYFLATARPLKHRGAQGNLPLIIFPLDGPGFCATSFREFCYQSAVISSAL